MRYLVKLPMAIIVRPEGEAGKTTPSSVRAALKDPFLRKLVPDGCLPVTPAEKQTTHKFDRGKGVTIDGHHYFPGELIKIRRKAIPLSEGYSVTDFYTQGMSFGDACWVAHINLPPGGGANATLRASMFVLFSRFKSWEHVKILRPLFTDNTPFKDKQKIIDRLLAITQLPDDFKAELRRLRAKDEETKSRLGDFFASVEQKSGTAGCSSSAVVPAGILRQAAEPLAEPTRSGAPWRVGERMGRQAEVVGAAADGQEPEEEVLFPPPSGAFEG